MVDNRALNRSFVRTDIRAHKLPDFFTSNGPLFPNYEFGAVVSLGLALLLAFFEEKSRVAALKGMSDGRLNL